MPEDGTFTTEGAEAQRRRLDRGSDGWGIQTTGLKDFSVNSMPLW